MFEDEYKYSVTILRGIAGNYHRLYQEGFTFVTKGGVHHVTPMEGMPLNIIDYKADFDTAWKALPWKMYIIVDYDIKGITDHELELLGYYNPPKYKAIAYRQMANYLNGRR